MRRLFALAVFGFGLVVTAAFIAPPIASPPPTPHIHIVLSPSGNEARYRVREQLVGIDFPSDAIGETQSLSGTLVLDADGHILRDSSRFAINLADLKSNKSTRDKYLRNHTLETEKFPTALLSPVAFTGITGPVPVVGTRAFQLLADFTVRGVTRPTTWNISATFDHGDVTGTATTAFTFKEMGLEQPNVSVLLSVEDTIKLEYDFHVVAR